MPQVDARALDHSDAMKSYFQEVANALVRRFRKTPTDARDLINRYFAYDVDPLERALLMHNGAEDVAADLAAKDASAALEIARTVRRPRRRTDFAAG